MIILMPRRDTHGKNAGAHRVVCDGVVIEDFLFPSLARLEHGRQLIGRFEIAVLAISNLYPSKPIRLRLPPCSNGTA
jgi:hypothetical protein